MYSFIVIVYDFRYFVNRGNRKFSTSRFLSKCLVFTIFQHYMSVFVERFFLFFLANPDAL